MLHPTTQRLVKEALLVMWRHWPWLESSSLWFSPYPSDDNERSLHSDACHVIAELGYIPTPDDSAVVLCETDSTDSMWAINVAGSQLRSVLVEVDAVGTVQAAVTEGRMERQMQLKDFGQGVDATAEVAGLIEDAQRLGLLANGFPIVDIVRPRQGPSIAATVLIVQAFAPIAVPCGYIVKSSFAEGFGNKRQRRLTQDKPIFSVLQADRLYREWPTRLPTQPVTPHWRRGHIRWLWARSGIKRQCLPRRSCERIRIGLAQHVRRVYVCPTWVGERQCDDDQMHHEILTGRQRLDRLNRRPDNGGRKLQPPSAP